MSAATTLVDAVGTVCALLVCLVLGQVRWDCGYCGRVMVSGIFVRNTDKLVGLILNNNNNRPDIIIKNKKEKTCTLIDVAIPADRNVVQKEAKKKLKYKSLCI